MCLFGQGASNVLANPPGGIRTESITFLMIKFFDCMHQTQISLLDEVHQIHTEAFILASDMHNESQVSLDELTLGFLDISFIHPTGRALETALSFASSATFNALSQSRHFL